MAQLKLGISGMTCDSCSKVVTRALASLPGVQPVSVNHASGQAVVEYDPAAVSVEDMIRAVSAKGYTATEMHKGEKWEQPVEEAHINYSYDTDYLSSLRRFLKALIAGNSSKLYPVESSLVIVAFATFLVMFMLDQLLLPAFFGPFGYARVAYFIPLLAIAVVFNAISLFHVKSYRGSVSCMTGMMIGMTVGMISGLTLGAISGATNGMFVGSVVGLVTGSAAGVYAGRCCGVMGSMEGIMAGIMSGTMGPMISIMMLADNGRLFLPLLIAAAAIVVSGLSFIMRQEGKKTMAAGGKAEPLGSWTFFGVSLAVFFAMAVLMVMGPKSSLVVSLS